MNFEEGTVCSHDDLGGGVRLLVLDAEKIATAAGPGQFVNVYLPSPGAFFLPRPFSIMESDEGRISILYKVIGIGTSIMSRWNPGHRVKLLGPLGNPLRIPQGKKSIILVAGGIGLPPIFFTLSSSVKGLHNIPELDGFFYGVAEKSQLYLIDRIRTLASRVFVSTDDGSTGAKGVVTDQLEEYLKGSQDLSTSLIAACGPRGMLGSIAQLADQAGVPAFFSVEERMACGTGVCQGCAVQVREGAKKNRFLRVCKDGPWFETSVLHEKALAVRQVDVAGREKMDATSPFQIQHPIRESSDAEAGNIDMSVDICPGLKTSNPLLIASGTFGYGLDYGSLWPADLPGGIITKAVTLEPRTGNPPPRISEVMGGMLNSIGLQNPGLDKFLDEILPKLENLGTKIIVNIAGNSADEYAILARELSTGPVDALEVNISCPNVKEGGLLFGSSPGMTEKITGTIRKETDLPLLIKLTPAVSDIAEIASAAERGGADAVSLINTLPAISVDLENRAPLLGNVLGGLSGPAVKPVALALLLKTLGSIRLPVIGGGGITSGRDALEFLGLGASAIQVGTALFADPLAPGTILESMKDNLANLGFGSVASFTGCCRPRDTH